jgi:hypothetical protein
MITLILTCINICLTCILLYHHIKNYKANKIGFQTLYQNDKVIADNQKKVNASIKSISNDIKSTRTDLKKSIEDTKRAIR